ncbi:response regulator transcription factor [Sphingomicrobium sediminis]|uniref:Helix-turn-helix transcriptional regulator n=1 Tax=Sphingomicrobium sediminis TaxID=2950949 RepID=A0A9X2J112_9SPHN|nr:helix-turn-helix transcriptional regulator [Sphingomicrobium sediminis]MCM8556254.1 helix-turn-helix transcriptional regulator [Sphingomicrobium sediminis]
MELSSAEVEQVAEIQRRLLELPRDRSMGAIREILERIAEFVGAKGGWSGNWFDGQLVFVPLNIGPQIEQQILDNYLGIDEEGFFLMKDPDYEATNRMRREMGSNVAPDWEVYPDSVRSEDWFTSIFVPAGAEWVIGMTARLPVGEAIMVFTYASKDDPNYRNERTVAKFKLIHPAFVAAFERLYEMSFDRDTFLGLIDIFPYPAILKANDGEICATSPGAKGTDWEGMVSKDEPRVFVLQGPNLPDLRGTQLAIDLSDSDADLNHLGRKAGLSERQSEVAEQIAMGHSDKEIARTLGISPNTARRHCEAVLDRLRVNSRSGVLMALLSGRSPRRLA